MNPASAVDIRINDRWLFRFSDTGPGGSLFSYTETGLWLGMTSPANGRPPNDVAFDLSFSKVDYSVSVMVERFIRGVSNDTIHRTYPGLNVLETLKFDVRSRAHVSGEYEIIYGTG
jgi:hypothetical protein